jgi:hypothetical protein
MKTCSIDGCERQAKARGWCIAHWERWRRHGSPLLGRKFGQGELLEYARSVVRQTLTNDCVLWPSALGQDGYGKVRYEGRTQNAHRVVLIIATGENPADLEAAHSCNNRACVNPAHLRWASCSENMQDKVLHGTATRGERSPVATITEKTALAIARETASHPYKDIAARHGVSVWIVADIASGRTWSHATQIQEGGRVPRS